MATQQQLFALMDALDRLPAAEVPLDPERARALGVPTAPDAAFEAAMETLFAVLEQPRPDPSVIEALVDVLEDVTNAPNTLRSTIGLRARAAAVTPRPMKESPAEAAIETAGGDWVSGDPKLLKAAKKTELAEERKLVLDALAKQGPSTYQALKIRDESSKASKALWSLVSDGLVEHSAKKPLVFRLVQRRRGEATACGVPEK